jgi:hypothetical protein
VAVEMLAALGTQMEADPSCISQCNVFLPKSFDIPNCDVLSELAFKPICRLFRANARVPCRARVNRVAVIEALKVI